MAEELDRFAKRSGRKKDCSKNGFGSGPWQCGSLYICPCRAGKEDLDMKGSGMLKMICLLVVGLFVLSGAPAFAQSQVNEGLPWDALIEFSGGSVAAGIGFSWGSGTLTQAGKQYPLKIDGLTVGNVGITKASAWGKVYYLKNLSDINGTYAAIGTGATVGGGGSAIAMKNTKGVVIDLYTTTEGAMLALGTGGVKIELKQ
jgi:hypothetical protein